MGESANLAFYAVVFAKGTVPKAKLDEALTRAVSTGAPLETTLVQTGALTRADCDALLKIREQLGRTCQSCEGITYLLQDQTEANTPCEYCGGRLLTREQQKAREQAKQAAPAGPVTARRSPLPSPSPVARRASEPTPAASSRPGAAPKRPEPAPAPRPAGAPLEPRLQQLENQLGALARELIEERQARAQMSQLLNEVAARAARADELAAQLEALRSELDAVRERTAGEGDPVERALAALQERLGVDDVSALPGRIAEQVAPRVLQAVRDRLGLDELAELPARVAAEARARLEQAGAPAIDEEALVRRVAERAQASAAPALDPDDLAARATEKAADEAARRALEAVEARLAALPPPDPRPDPLEEAALVERVLEAVTARLPASDPAALEERITRRALDAVTERLERQPDPRELIDAAVPRAVEEATARALESLGARIDEVAAAASAPREQAPSADALEALARAAAEGVVKEAIERLDDPRELIQRAQAQVTRSVDERVEALRAEAIDAAKAAAIEAAKAAAAEAARAGGAPADALAALDARVSLIAGELKDALETLDARIAALRERTGRTPRPEKQDEALVSRAVAAATEALEGRLAALEARAPAAAAEEGSPGAGDGTIVQRAVQAVWDQLASLDLPGLPARVSDQVLATVTKKLETDMAGLVDKIAQEATAPILRSIEARLEKLDLKRLPERITREVSEQVRGALGRDEALVEALVERVAERVGSAAGRERREADAAPLAPEVEQLVDRAAARALEWVEDRLTALERGGGIELEMARAAARAVATEVVEQRLREHAAHPSPADFDGAKTVVVDPSKSGSFEARAGEPKTGVFDKKFIALAREVKNLKDVVDELQAGGAARPTGASPELVNLLASPEFKQAFDAKVKEVLNYVKNDLVPSAVKRALQAPEGSS